jgi:PAS domain S-box-containing protein
MRLRFILLVLSLLAFVSASTGGYLFYYALRKSAFQEAERQAQARLETFRIHLEALLSENLRPVRTLAAFPEMQDALVNPSSASLGEVNRILDHFKATLEVDVCYLMDTQGNTVASSNRHDPDSFVGLSFAFRPYFRHAMSNLPGFYMALGTASRKRGAYCSYAVPDPASDTPIGVVVLKSSIDVIEARLGLTRDDIVLVTDPQGMIFISNRADWLFKLARQATPRDLESIVRQRQFGAGPWEWIGLEHDAANQGAVINGERYLLHQAELASFPGWRVIHLRNSKAIAAAVSAPFFRITGPVVLCLCLLIGTAVFLLYRKASGELAQRRAVESALRESEERYRSLYHRTPAMLHSIDTEGRLVSVSDFWAEALGYSREEVIGRPLTGFMAPESRHYAENTVLPEFFKCGFCKDITYRFLTKSGKPIDILLSAIADRDHHGTLVRTLAVSIDVTQRKRAEEALRLAKEELSRYSKDLEHQVNLRTREITSILKHTPAVVYFKDMEGRYQLVNAGFEELFGVQNDAVRGRTDEEILPREVADQFRAGEMAVMAERRSHQVEELIPHVDGPHTFLSVKFPVYDEKGTPRGVCGIATDITAVKKAQDQLRRLSGSIMANQEKERTAIARELHDELGQVLTALRMDAIWIHERLKTRNDSVAARALTMCRLIDKTISDVRSLAYRLRPGVLDDLGLVDALELYTSDFENRTGILCVFDHQAVASLGDTVATAAYRITQEALTNVARHARAGHVTVSLEAGEARLTLAVTDDGRGFKMDGVEESEGLGLAGMRERAALAGGRLTISSSPGQGTQVVFVVPLGDQLSLSLNGTS